MAASEPPNNREKRKHKTLTIQTKIEIIKRLENGENGASLARIYGIGRATISGLRIKKESIMQYASKLDSDDGLKHRKTLRTADNTILEDAVYSWLTERRSIGERISGPLICEKALELNRELNGPSTFKASKGWLKNFKLRHGIRKFPIQNDRIKAETFDFEFVTTEEPDLEDAVEDSNDDDVQDIGPSHSEAFYAFETALNWCEKQTECSSAELVMIQRLKALAAKKTVMSEPHLDILSPETTLVIGAAPPYKDTGYKH